MGKYRSRSGCLTCRARRVKCDETRPVCKACSKKNRPCHWEAPHARFKDYQPHETNSSRLMTRGARPAGVLPGANETRTSSDRPGMTPDSASRSTSDLSYNDSVGIHFPGSLFSHSAPRTQSSISVASLLRQPSPEGTRPYSQEDIPLTQREARLVHYYSEHLGGWLDCTDATRQFALRVPEKVKRCPVLFHAVLSFAACHRREDDIADAAYQRCIALLVDCLNEPHASHDETLLCAIVILRFYEQLNVFSTANSDTAQRLSGFSSILRASQGDHYVDPSAPTIREAAFWVYVRQCLYVASIKQQPPDVDFSLQLHPTPGSMQDSHPLARLRLETAWANQMTWNTAPHLDDLLGSLCSSRIKNFCRKHSIESSSIDLVGIHSEALRLFNAQHNLDGAQERPLHRNSVVAAETGISTIFYFAIIECAVVRPRVHPTTYVDRVFLQHPSKFRVSLNIDEIASLSFIPANGDYDARATISRNVGPGSLLIDYAMRYCTSNDQSEDHDGKVGSRGIVNQDIADRFLDAHDYLRFPRSQHIATEMFGDHEAQQLIDECLYSNMSEVDTLATVTRITAQNILKQYRRLLQLFFQPDQQVDELFIGGRSARNSNIIDYLESELPESVITKPLSDIGIPGDAHEAVCYAHLGLEAVLNQVTQAADASLAPTSAYPNADAVRAKVVPGRRWDDLISNVLEFEGGQQVHVATDVRNE